jgi:hypothetical protein
VSEGLFGMQLPLMINCQNVRTSKRISRGIFGNSPMLPAFLSGAAPSCWLRQRPLKFESLFRSRRSNFHHRWSSQSHLARSHGVLHPSTNPMATSEVAQCLAATLSPEANTRIAAELKLSELFTRPGAYLMTLSCQTHH